MLLYRKILLLLTVGIVIGSLAVTLSIGLYWRSARYRENLEEKLSDRIGLHVALGSVKPLSLHSRRFRDVHVELPRRDAKVFKCSEAIWRNHSEDQNARYTLVLNDGWLLIGANEWKRADYDRMLRGGLGHDFASLRLGEIHLAGIDLRWVHPDFTLRAPNCSGEIRFDEDGMGRASLMTNGLNSFETGEPINIVANFTPGPRLRFHNVALGVPEAPLSSLGLDSLLGNQVTQGDFVGTVIYQEKGDHRLVALRGEIREALLGELTAPLQGGPYDGEVNIELDQAELVDGSLRTLRFSGQLSDLRLEQLAPVARMPGLTGRVDLRVRQARYENGVVDYFNAEGHGTGLPLGKLTERIGRGRITGTAMIDIDSLIIERNQLQSANVMLEAVPPKGGPATIDRAILKTASEELLGIDATAILPKDVTHVEYARLGVRLIIDRGRLWVHGTHGDDGRTILTVKLFGRELGVVRAPRSTYAVDDILEAMQARLEQYDSQDLREWWRSREDSPPGDDPDNDAE